MDVSRLLEQARDQVTVGRVFGEPIERDGVTMVPVARVMGGGGGGQGSAPDGEGEGEGGGFGMVARPAGAYVIKGGDVTWRPAVDPVRLSTVAATFVGFVVLVRALARRGRSAA